MKIRLKQSVIERKARISGQAGIRRHERILQAAQRRQQKQNSTLPSKYETYAMIGKEASALNIFNLFNIKQMNCALLILKTIFFLF